MAERYNKLYTLPGNLYSKGAPVLIAAGALLKDSQTGKVLAQLKFRSISPRQITALKVQLCCYDMAGEQVCTAEHQYLDLKVKRDDSFGSKEAIPLPDSAVRSYTARVLRVYFEDGERWSAGEDAQWEALPAQEQLRDKLFDRELLRQYRLETSDKSEYVARSHKDIWLCACGEINPMGDKCHKCGQQLDELKYLLDVDLLLEKKNNRLVEESKAAAKRESSRASSLKVVKIVLLIMLPILLAAGAFYFYHSHQQQLALDYEMANMLLESGRYADAAAAYDALGDYMDAEAKATEARAVMSELNNYDKAKKFLENGRYEDAREAFLAMGDYEDAPELAKEALYLYAVSLIEKGELESSRDTFVELGEYKDSKAQAESFKMLLTKEETSYNAECEGPLTTTYSYDEQGRIAVKTEHFSAYEGLSDRVLSYKWNGDGSYSVTEHKTVREYDTWGILLSVDGVAQYSYEYGYFDDGSLQFYGAYDATGFVYEQVYDKQGNPVRYSTADGQTSATTNEYDESGRLIKQENFDSENKFIDRTSFEYDAEGRLKRSTYMDLNSTTAVTSYSYELKYVPGAAE